METGTRRHANDESPEDLLDQVIHRVAFVEAVFAKMPPGDNDMSDNAIDGFCFILQDIQDDLKWISDEAWKKKREENKEKAPEKS